MTVLYAKNFNLQVHDVTKIKKKKYRTIAKKYPFYDVTHSFDADKLIT